MENALCGLAAARVLSHSMGVTTKQLLRIMKNTAIILLLACLSATARGYTQKVTLSEKNAPLEKVFAAIKKQTGYAFFYDQSLLQKAKKIDIEVSNTSLETALTICFNDQPLTYTIVGTTV